MNSILAKYPLSERATADLRTPSGKKFEDIDLDAVVEGRVEMKDLRVSPEALELQAEIAQAAGRPQLAENLRRAAELANIPEEKILEIYAALRPGRSSHDRLVEVATELEQKWRAPRCAQFVREALKAYFKDPGHPRSQHPKL